MSKWIMAIAAIATLTSVSSVSTAPAQAQSNCITHVCKDTPNGSSSPATSCDEHLGYLRQVYKSEIAGIDDGYRVWVTELCSDFGLLSSEGNAAYLRPTIAKNAVLVEALSRKAYKPVDVFAVQMMGDDTINLFVHRFGS